MKILTGAQIKEADRFTIENEPIESILLMERAAEVIAQWICNNISQDRPLSFFIGKGNNGGDGLAVARMLYNAGYNCRVYTIFDKKQLSNDCRYNLDRLPRGLKPVSLRSGGDMLSIQKDDFSEGEVIIDALLGVGIHGPVSEPLNGIIEFINSLSCEVISIDMPSGMPTEGNVPETSIINASTTLTIEYPKLSMLLPENGEKAGKIVVLPIDLDKRYFDVTSTPYYYVDRDYIAQIVLPRPKFAHKGVTGHALLVCGSEGMTGAAVLASGAALRSGCGLVTIHLPYSERAVIHTVNPSALVSCDSSAFFSQLPENLEKYNVIGIGCGLGKHDLTIKALSELLAKFDLPMVIDADALNIIAEHPEYKKFIPQYSVLTPHIGELKRLVGTWDDDTERNLKVRKLAAEISCYIVVKGAHTMIATSDGRMLFNSTGNSGMAKGGSGDVLTGYITGLLARGYSSESAAVLGVYIHGRAGDKAAEYFGVEGMNSSDIIDFLGEAMSEIS